MPTVSPSTFTLFTALDFTNSFLVRFLYSSNIISVADTEKLFPDIHAVFILPKGFQWTKLKAYTEYDRDFSAELRLHRPVLSETLSSLLDCPIKWEHSPASERHPIGAVRTIALGPQGALVGEVSPRSYSVIRNTVSNLRVEIQDCVQHAKMEESVREIARWAPASRGSGSERPRIGFYANFGASLDACLANVRLALAKE